MSARKNLRPLRKSLAPRSPGTQSSGAASRKKIQKKDGVAASSGTGTRGVRKGVKRSLANSGGDSKGAKRVAVTKKATGASSPKTVKKVAVAGASSPKVAKKVAVAKKAPVRVVKKVTVAGASSPKVVKKAAVAGASSPKTVRKVAVAKKAPVRVVKKVSSTASPKTVKKVVVVKKAPKAARPSDGAKPRVVKVSAVRPKDKPAGAAGKAKVRIVNRVSIEKSPEYQDLLRKKEERELQIKRLEREYETISNDTKELREVLDEFNALLEDATQSQVSALRDLEERRTRVLVSKIKSLESDLERVDKVVQVLSKVFAEKKSEIKVKKETLESLKAEAKELEDAILAIRREILDGESKFNSLSVYVDSAEKLEEPLRENKAKLDQIRREISKAEKTLETERKARSLNEKVLSEYRELHERMTQTMARINFEIDKTILSVQEMTRSIQEIGQEIGRYRMLDMESRKNLESLQEQIAATERMKRDYQKLESEEVFSRREEYQKVKMDLIHKEISHSANSIRESFRSSLAAAYLHSLEKGDIEYITRYLYDQSRDLVDPVLVVNLLGAVHKIQRLLDTKVAECLNDGDLVFFVDTFASFYQIQHYLHTLVDTIKRDAAAGNAVHAEKFARSQVGILKTIDSNLGSGDFLLVPIEGSDFDLRFGDLLEQVGGFMKCVSAFHTVETGLRELQEKVTKSLGREFEYPKVQNGIARIGDGLADIIRVSITYGFLQAYGENPSVFYKIPSLRDDLLAVGNEIEQAVRDTGALDRYMEAVATIVDAGEGGPLWIIKKNVDTIKGVPGVPFASVEELLGKEKEVFEFVQGVEELLEQHIAIEKDLDERKLALEQGIEEGKKRVAKLSTEVDRLKREAADVIRLSVEIRRLTLQKANLEKEKDELFRGISRKASKEETTLERLDKMVETGVIGMKHLRDAYDEVTLQRVYRSTEKRILERQAMDLFDQQVLMGLEFKVLKF